HLGWRTIFLLLGVPGLAVALLTRLVLREPPRGFAEGREDVGVEPVRDVLAYFWSRRSMRQILVAATLHTMAIGAHVTFNFALLVRVHGFTGAEAGLVIGVMTGVFGVIGTYAGGWLGDRFGVRDARWYVWWLGIGAAVSIPLTVLGYLAPSPLIAVGALSLGALGSYMYAGACHVVAQSLARPRMRGMTAATMLFAMNLVGYGLGPPIAGAISDALGGEGALRYALAAMNLVHAQASADLSRGSRGREGLTAGNASCRDRGARRRAVPRLRCERRGLARSASGPHGSQGDFACEAPAFARAG
ncbi:MAG TPA: MFS transporter, partial [Myxococcota bacterium]|nr:MFS transporter [Myxococcota bacterium]